MLRRSEGMYGAGTAIHVMLHDVLTQDLRTLIERGLDQHAEEHNVPPRNAKSLVVSASVNGTDVAGALSAKTFWTCLAIDLMWVQPALRCTGVGRTILTRAENEARKRGCVIAVVDTASFQAPGFYMSCGYVEAFRIPDVPPGRARIYLTKRLA